MASPLSVHSGGSVIPVIDIPGRGILFAVGDTFPPDGSLGYAGGCHFIDINSGTWYYNAGSDTSSNFDQVTLP